jgi:short-subunit dehydrogenase
MNKNKKKNIRIILSISSDIGFNLALDWIKRGDDVYGTYRIFSSNCIKLLEIGAKLFKCDLESTSSIKKAAIKIKKLKNWNTLILAAGTQDPIGKFGRIRFDSWEKSIKINLINQLRFFHEILNKRDLSSKIKPRVIFFAGGATNSSNKNYSAYTISKIASIKMCELLASEIPDTIFSILGPGWVKTKIHDSTIKNKKNSEENYYKTISMLNSNECYPMYKIVKCVNWLIKSPGSLVNGRNFSAAYDPWENKKINQIKKDFNCFKLRRFGNNLFNS